MKQNKMIIETELFKIYFSRAKSGEANQKFTQKEKGEILEIVKNTEETLVRMLEFSMTPPLETIYHVPIIFEKVSKKIHNEKHEDHYGFLTYPPIGYMWNKTVKFEGIEIKSKTAIINICPINENSLNKTISHEITHAFHNSFLDADGVNFQNRKYFLEGFTELIAQLTYYDEDEFETTMKD